MWVYYLFSIVISYFIGAIPVGYLIAKGIKGIDIRTVGSGNVGATNVGRVLGWYYGIVCFILDALKGIFAILFVSGWNKWLSLSIYASYEDLTFYVICGIVAILGHLFPIYLKFKGGKGVATAFGVFMFFIPIPTVIASAIWLFSVLLFRYISIASILAAISLPIMIKIIGIPDRIPGYSGHYNLSLFIVSLTVSLLVIIRHIPNIKRLINGTEPRVSFRRKNETEK